MTDLVGIVYDAAMLNHRAPGSHPERASRVAAIYDNLVAEGVFERETVVRVASRAATTAELERVHTGQHLRKFYNRTVLGSIRLPVHTVAVHNGVDTFVSAGTHLAALLSAGCAIQLADSLLAGSIRHGFAIVRPPSHHAKCGPRFERAGNGFCFLNGTAACAVKLADAGKKVLIVDFDVHLGDGTIAILRSALHKRNDALRYFSIHRWDGGLYYPYGGRGKSTSSLQSRIALVGFTGPQDDAFFVQTLADYLAAIEPANKPDVIVVSAGFDAACGDPLGGCLVTPAGYRAMTRLMANACPSVLMVLEGGYNLDMLASCSYACIDELCQ